MYIYIYVYIYICIYIYMYIYMYIYIYIKWSDIVGLRVTSESSHFDYGPIHQLKHTGTIVPADETDLNI